eukprot:TRINITY_DN15862_c0_g1_i1.p1 TRINITY_DN15862_c0_g1~~TRINITY_DN15862_c0_g1_i1.p1  ORF type:complete len:241 (-),score=45.83 TRINITY_DN15862_c0_g1_i1:7-729(-)
MHNNILSQLQDESLDNSQWTPLESDTDKALGDQTLVNMTIINSKERLVEERPTQVSAICERICDEQGIQVLANTRVVQVREHELDLEDGTTLSFDLCVWATGPRAPSMLQQTDLPLSDKGYMRVNSTLQCVDFPNVFGGGDCIHIDQHPDTPKAGVYAVREGPFIADNIQKFLQNQELVEYEPQSGFLSLLVTGQETAVGVWKGFCVEGSWVWKTKDWIDQSWMNRFPRLTDRDEAAEGD